jgi:hypothetical protein
MRRTTEKEIQTVLRLDGSARFNHFVKRVVDSEAAWGLWKDGWALMENDDGTQVFPLWPAREYAELHRTGNWAEYEAREIPLADILDELVPKLAQGGILPGVFPTQEGKGVTPTPEALAASLRKELENYK